MSKINTLVSECKALTDDPFWLDMLTSCSEGSFPRGIKYDSQKCTMFVRCKKGSKNASEIFNIQGPVKERYDTLMHVFRVLLGIDSPNDLAAIKAEMDEIRDDQKVDMNMSWVKLKPKYLKNHLLTVFAVNLATEYGLEKKAGSVLYKRIMLGIQFKTISPSDIEYDGKEIVSIRGLEFDEETESFIITNSKGPIQKPSVIKNDMLNKSVEKHYKTLSNNKLRV